MSTLLSKAIDEALNANPVAAAERATGRGVRQSQETLALSLLLARESREDLESLLELTGDAHDNLPVGQYLGIARSLGFKLVYTGVACLVTTTLAMFSKGQGRWLRVLVSFLLFLGGVAAASAARAPSRRSDTSYRARRCNAGPRRAARGPPLRRRLRHRRCR